jgi:GNAT acetyltransferase-like protein
MRMPEISRDLLADYEVEIDSVNQATWASLLTEFDDASIHQTWQAGAILGKGRLSHIVLRRSDQAVALCQVILKKLPLMGETVADVYSGPMWRRRGREPESRDHEAVIECLKREYASKRRLALRVWPNAFDDSPEIDVALQASRFHPNSAARVQRTLILDIAPPLDILRNNLGKTWRLHLNRAEKSGLEVVTGTGDELYAVFLEHLREMIARKRFVPRQDYAKYRVLQQQLPSDLKMQIFVAQLHGKPVCSLVCTAVGDTGVYLFGATPDLGLKSHGSNLLHWRAIEWLKDRGYKRYDLGGIDPDENPGTYQFKRGLAGALGEDRRRLGEYHFSDARRGQLSLAMITRILPWRDRLRAKRLLDSATAPAR